MIKPFKLRVPNNTLNKIYNKVRKYPWANIQNMNGWEHGTNLKYLKEISKYWITKYNWRKQEKKINDPRITAISPTNFKFLNKYLDKKDTKLFWPCKKINL